MGMENYPHGDDNKWKMALDVAFQFMTERELKAFIRYWQAEFSDEPEALP